MIFFYLLIFSICSINLHASSEYNRVRKLRVDQAQSLIESYKKEWFSRPSLDIEYQHEAFCNMSVAYYWLAEAQEREAETNYKFAKKIVAELKRTQNPDPQRILVAERFRQKYKQSEDASRVSYGKAQKYIDFAVSLHPKATIAVSLHAKATK